MAMTQSTTAAAARGGKVAAIMQSWLARLSVSLSLLALCAVQFWMGTAYAQQVTLAGFAFAGEYAEAAARYPYSFKVVQRATAEKLSGAAAMSRLTVDRARLATNQSLTLNFDSLASLKAADQALVAALVLTGETVLVESFGAYHKIFLNLRADALIFDFKAQAIVRAYPLSIVIFDATPRTPSAEYLEAQVAKMISGNEETSLLGQFAKALSSATVPAPGTKTAQVRTTEVADGVLALYPEELRKPSIARMLLADAFASSLSAKTGVPLIPSKVTHSTGVMRVRFDDMYNYDLKIPEGDYTFDIKLKRLAKVQHATNNIGTSYIFGAFVDLEFSEPLLNQKFFSSELKNGETAVIPAGRQSSDDFPAYQDAVRGLFRKFAEAILNPSSKWLRSASQVPDIEAQIKKTKEIVESAKL
jgi:hypothetical protein